MVEALIEGLALGAVVAVVAVWALAASSSGVPHLGVGAVSGVGAALAARMAGVPTPVAVAVGALGGAAAGAAGAVVDGRVRARADAPSGLADAVVLALFLGVAAAIAPLAVPVRLAPASASTAGAVVAVAALGCALAVARLVGPETTRARRISGWDWRRWALFGGLGGLAAAGVVATSPAAAGIFGLWVLPDGAGVAARAGVVVLAARGRPVDTVGAGLGLGVAEGLVRLVDPAELAGGGVVSALPLVGLALLALWTGPRSREQGAGQVRLPEQPGGGE